MHPKSPHVNFRNTSKTNFQLFVNKLEKLADSWNMGNPYKAFEAKSIDISLISDKFDKNFSSIFLDNPDKWRIEAMDG